ncbi:hypothetical protein ACIPUD_21185 [Bradyrhizobium sp. CAR08]
MASPRLHGRGMAKAAAPITKHETAAREAFAKINAKIPELSDRRRQVARQIVEIEQVGPAGVPLVFPVEPPDESKNLDAPAFALLNGAAVGPAPSKASDPAVKLNSLQRELAVIDRAIVLAQGQANLAASAASREAAEEYKETSRSLHRHRALLIVSLLKANEDIEALRGRTAVGGSSADSSLEGFTIRLFGLPSTPSHWNIWPRRYLDACVEAGVITKDESQ